MNGLDSKIIEIPHLVTHTSFNEKKAFLSRIAVKRGVEYIIIPIKDILYFKLENGIVFLVNNGNKKFIVPHNLLQLETKLDPAIFNRVNRQFIINGMYVKGFTSLGKSKFMLQFTVDVKENVFISQYGSGQFREWIETCTWQ